MTQLFYEEVFKKLEEKKVKYFKENKKPSAERILIWLEEANQFVKTFLSPKDIQKWRKIRNESIKNPS